MNDKKLTRAALLEVVIKACESASPGTSHAKIAQEIVARTKCGYATDYVTKLVTKERQASGREDDARATSHWKIGRSQIHDIIEAYVSADPGCPGATLARKIMRDNPGVNYHVNHLAVMIREYKRRNNAGPRIDIAPPEGSPTGQEKWKVTDGKYEWKASFGNMSIPVEEADAMFYEYSRHGLDLSQAQMRGRHDLKIWEWHSVKRALFMYKDSNIFSPWTEDNTPKDKLQQVINDKMDEKMKDKQRLVESSYQKETLKRYKQVIEKDAIETFAVENLADELNDMMSDWKTKVAIVKRTREYGTERKWLVCPIADLHIGARVEGLTLTPDFSPAQARHHLDTIAKRINAAGASDVSIVLMGDLIESFTGLNHVNAWQSVEYGMIGATVIKETMSILEEFIAKVDNVREILGVSGNHDRISSNAKEDRKGQVAEIIFYMLDRLYGATFDVKFADLVLNRQIDGVQYIFAHGDKKVIREGKQAVIDYGDSNLFNLIITAHKHCRRVIEDERSYRWLQLPAVFTGNRYSEENAWNARAGFDTFENDGTGRPIQTSYTIA